MSPGLHDVMVQFLQGMAVTLELSLAGFTLALVVGTGLAAAVISPVPPARWAASAYVTVFRNLPLLVILILAVFGLPQTGLQMAPITWAMLVLGLYTAAFVCVTLSGGVNGVDVGQAEAARALGLSFPQSLRLVVLPQAIRSVVPPLGSLFIALTRNTALTSVIGVVEISARTAQLVNANVSTIVVIIGSASGYLIINLPAAWVVRHLERRAVFAR